MKKFDIKGAGAPGTTFAVKGAKALVDPVDAALDEMANAADDIERDGPDGRAMFAAYDQAIKDVTDSEFYVVPTATIAADGTFVEVSLHPAIVFQSRALKEEFLAKMAERFPGEILGDKYISGDLIARALGFELTATPPKLKGEWEPSERLKKMARG